MMPVAPRPTPAMCCRTDSRELLCWCAAVQRQGEAFVVIPSLPVAQRGLGVSARGKRLAGPEFLAVNAMTSFHLAVLLRPSRFDVAMPHAGCLDRETKREREFRTVVALNLPNGERQRAGEFSQEVETGVLIQAGVESEHSHPRKSSIAVYWKTRSVASLTTLTSTWTESPGCSFSNSFSCRGRRFDVFVNTGRPRSRKTR